VNASNYRPTPHLEKYAAWISACLESAGPFRDCASQYFPANPNDFSTLGLTDQW
jgi:endoglucanase